jgi:hypothetical protein
VVVMDSTFELDFDKVCPNKFIYDCKSQQFSINKPIEKKDKNTTYNNYPLQQTINLLLNTLLQNYLSTFPHHR